MMRCMLAGLLAVGALLTGMKPVQAQASGRRTLDPPGLPPARGYSHVVITPAGRRVSISGQVAMDSLGNVVGAGDFKAQCVQVFENLRRALRGAGADFPDIVSTTMYVTDLSQLDVLREVRARYLPADNPPASTLVQVVALFRPELMIEVAVEAALP